MVRVSGRYDHGDIVPWSNTSSPTEVGEDADWDETVADLSGPLDALTDVNAPTPGDGDVLTWDNGAGEWVAAPAALTPGTDVGDLLVWDGAAWALLPVGANDEVLTADSGETLGVKWAAGTGGGGLTQAYVGYNTVGGSIDTPGVNYKIYIKQVTLANDCLVASVGGYVSGASASAAVGPAVAVYTDSGGAPGIVIAYNGPAAILGMTTGRWVDVPLGVWLVAGTYWIALRTTDLGGSIVCRLNYDGSGSDRTGGSGQSSWPDWSGVASPTTTSNRYSIRATTIR